MEGREGRGEVERHGGGKGYIGRRGMRWREMKEGEKRRGREESTGGERGRRRRRRREI